MTFCTNVFLGLSVHLSSKTVVITTSALKPEEFKFKLSHELAHLAARDYQSDQIVGSHYICCAPRRRFYSRSAGRRCGRESCTRMHWRAPLSGRHFQFRTEL
jgi:hypothetical protein